MKVENAAERGNSVSAEKDEMPSTAVAQSEKDMTTLIEARVEQQEEDDMYEDARW